MSWYADVELPWHIHYEHRLSSAYHWSLTEINDAPAIDLIAHLILIRRREASDRDFACWAGSFSDISPSARKQIAATLAKEMETGRRRLTEYEVADPESRITMIGRSLRIHGDRWAAQNAAELNWLAAQRITIEDAVKRSIDWETTKNSDEFWK